MRQSVPRGNKKKPPQPVIVTVENKFTPKISERTKKRRQAAKERRLNPTKFASGLDTCGVVCLYGFLILAVLIGGGGIALCIIYFSTSSSTQGWKIAGIVLGGVTCVIGIILILLTIFKQARNRPWQYKKKQKLVTDDYDDDMDEYPVTIENLDGEEIQHNVVTREDSLEGKKEVAHSATFHRSPVNGNTREIATSPLPDSSVGPLNLKTLESDIIFCPGCNRTHPSAHQCMYSTRLANGFATQIRTVPQATQHDSIAIQTEDDGAKKKRTGPHTVIDRSLKYSNTIETQTDVSAKPKSNITESIILRRVPIPTAKVVVQQPTTKVMIVKVPNVAGQLVIQPKTGANDTQTK